MFGFVIALLMAAGMFVYFYLFFFAMNRKKTPSSVEKKPSFPLTPSKTESVAVFEMSFLELKQKVSSWMKRNGLVQKDSTQVTDCSVQERYENEDPIFQTTYLVFVYHCGPHRSVVPVDLLLQFRDCVRLLAVQKGFVVTNGGFPSQAVSLFEEAPVQFLGVDQI